MNGEQTGFVKWVNQLQMVAFSALISQVVWLIGSLTLTYIDYELFLGSTENHRSYGLQLAIALLAAWTGKSITNAAANFGQRATAREYVEAKHRGQMAGAAIAEQVKTQEHPAVQTGAVRHMEIKTGNGDPTVAEGAHPDPEKREWASGDPNAGLL